MAGMFRHLPRQCQNGTCDHAPGRCIRYRSRGCISGECAHARQNLHCGEAPAPSLREGGSGPGVSPDQTRERPDLIPPALAVVPDQGDA